MRHMFTTGATIACLLAPAAFADSAQNLSQAAGDSSEASAQIVAAGGQVALGAVALPLIIGGEITAATGKGAAGGGEMLWDAANAPLKLDDRIALAQPAPQVPRLPTNAGGEE